MTYKSETSKFRYLFIDYCKGNGIDIGFGGDAVVPEAITIDLKKPYAKCGYSVQNLKGDGLNLYWFKNNTLDYVYSSHLLEDFENTKACLLEWKRVIKKGGYLLLLLPNEQRYSKPGRKNRKHKHKDFSLKKVKAIIKGIDMKIVKEYDKLIYEDTDYNFALIIQKK